jgi:Zn finger protein HypA/HybF involved in hydrogenase expression
MFACECGGSVTVSSIEIKGKGEIRCPHCGGDGIALSSGREVDILSIEVV